MNTGTATQGPRSNLRTIVITLDSNGNPQVSSGDETAVISPKKNEEILWKSAHSFLIDFNGNSPFYEQQFSDKYAQSGAGAARRSVQQLCFLQVQHHYKWKDSGPARGR
jgi:hypothetical protein